MSADLCLVLGGVRSGKSAFAESRVASFGQLNGGSILYVATGVAFDDEMAERIQLHQRSRPESWATLEEPLKLAESIIRLLGEEPSPGAVIIDSIDVWVGNLLMEYENEPKQAMEQIVTKETDKLLVLTAMSDQSFVFVSSEVGMSLVPVEPLGRRFQDILGTVNQRIAATATEVHMLVAGIPVEIKSNIAE
ncbi:MAG: bifunctional adenosylcobinamide kinase/adenosylcobinamide-phosphate guanylyltransferase [Chloroflexota bacterium]|nr:bifunctional adenosylcobinamide kinase/adenosylcobinamide-phosphate guanylyltransferase [Chloroflexota bacterium]|tara:strand:- start:91 stop:666 length:576 start_codon:yes stop_codon:yes gene_type:complete